VSKRCHLALVTAMVVGHPLYADVASVIERVNQKRHYFQNLKREEKRILNASHGKIALPESLTGHFNLGMGYGLENILDRFYFQSATWEGAAQDGWADGPGTLTAVTNSRMIGTSKWVIEGTVREGSFFGKLRCVNTLDGRFNYDTTVYVDHKSIYKEASVFTGLYEKALAIVEEVEAGATKDDQSMCWKHREDILRLTTDGVIVLPVTSGIKSLLAAKKIDWEMVRKQGPIGTRYVPEVANERVTSETLYYVGNTPVRQDKSYMAREGGYKEDRVGYTQVYRLTNEEKSDMVVDLAFIGKSGYVDKVASTSGFWIFKENVLKEKAKTNAFFLRRPVLVKAGETVKDQLVLGESYSGFYAFVVGAYSVDKSFTAALEKALLGKPENRRDAKALLGQVQAVLAKPESSPWKDQLQGQLEVAERTVKNQNRKDMEQNLVTHVVLPSNFDPDFTNKAILKVVNKSKFSYTASFSALGQPDFKVEVGPKQTVEREFTYKDKSKGDIEGGFKLKDITSQDHVIFVDEAPKKATPAKMVKSAKK